MSQWIATFVRGHNSGLCLLKDGEIVLSIEEERLSRNKYDGGPYACMTRILDFTDKLDYLVIAHTQPLSELVIVILVEIQSMLHWQESWG